MQAQRALSQQQQGLAAQDSSQRPSAELNGNSQLTPDASSQVRTTDGSEAQRIATQLNQATPTQPIRQAWEHIEEVGQILKTAFPLLIMSLETIVDQLNQRFKLTTDEDLYRLIFMLCADSTMVSLCHLNCVSARVNAIQHFVNRMSPDDDGTLPSSTMHTIVRMVQNLSGQVRVSSNVLEQLYVL
jgi:transformation/transcription domain-associated protein